MNLQRFHGAEVILGAVHAGKPRTGRIVRREVVAPRRGSRRRVATRLYVMLRHHMVLYENIFLVNIMNIRDPREAP